ncbi:MAG: DUF2029 domain-containing protein [Roseiflexaceae bacterium]|nr:DUF2029 domain-containing protein [Roseiflexaceae bacterium]
MFSVLCSFLLPLAFLSLPITREWAVLMRVDLLGVALGLWGLYYCRLHADRRLEQLNLQSTIYHLGSLLPAALLLTASLFTKPSLLAAPVAACVWLLLRDWRRGLLLIALLGVLGGGMFAWLAAGSHFFVHVVVANANAWDGQLAADFWRGQLAIHGLLFVAALLAGAALLRSSFGHGMLAPSPQPSALAAAPSLQPLAPVLIYTLVAAATAVGVGKLGAYLNYFLELYAGLLWLVGIALVGVGGQGLGIRSQAARLLPFGLVLLTAASLMRYYPTWSDQYTKLAGVIEGENPPRLIVGRRGVWQDLQRERQILATQARVNAALVAEVRAAGGPIFTDIPGVAAQAGQVARLQAFEHSQIIQLWDQRSLRRDLANGQVPLVVLDYLGNWLSPEAIALIRRRYAQQGSRGGYDLYRPVEPGPLVKADQALGDVLRLAGFRLSPTVDGRWRAGSHLVATLELARQDAPQDATAQPRTLTLLLRDADGQRVAAGSLPLFYGALRPDELTQGEAVQHMQALRLPVTLASGRYQLGVQIDDGPEHALASVEIAQQDGALLANGWLENGDGIYVPAPLWEFWRRQGGELRFGLPISPAVPFAEFTQQCFERGCLRLRGGAVEQSPLGEWLAAGDIGANNALNDPQLAEPFQQLYADSGGAAGLGAPLTNAFRSGNRLVQYTAFARLELADGGAATFGNIGEDALRLPGGEAYRWP